ncbi:hypothetical protein LTR97_003320 [Elasticomyces elasticus]|uniref:Uncharacterized protein n=1 Tax=Elasticomyces elasticus TaxID=574655 RepID=A0AAN7WGL3_9PEZI|nr:hypothetical protein LTR97_003320 [Elasticomyces elasticus]
MWRQRRQVEQQKLNNGQHAVTQWSAVPGHQPEDRKSVKIAKQHHSKAESGAQVAAREKAEEVGEDEDSAEIQITFQKNKATKKRRNEASSENETATRQKTNKQQSRHKADTHDPLVSLSQSAKDVYAATSALVVEMQTDWLRWIAHATTGYPIQEAELVERLELSKDIIHQACSELCDAGLMKEKSSLKRWYYTVPNAELQAKSQSTTVASWNERRTEFEEHIAATIKKYYDSEAEESTSVDAAEGPLLNDASGSVSAPQQADEAVDILTSLERRREVDIWDPLSSISKNAQTVYKAATAHQNVQTARSEEADLGPHITTRNLLGWVRHYYHLRKSDEYLLRFCTELCDLGLLKLLRKDRWVPVEVRAWRFQLQEDMDVAWSSVTGPSGSGSTGGNAASTRSAADRLRAVSGRELQYFDHALDVKDPLTNVSKRCRLLYWHMQDMLVEDPYLDVFQEYVLAGIFHRSIQQIHKDMLELRRYGLVKLFLSAEDGWLPVPLALWREQLGEDVKSEAYTDLQGAEALPLYSGSVASLSNMSHGQSPDEGEQDEEIGNVQNDIEVEQSESGRSEEPREDREPQRWEVEPEDQECEEEQHEEESEADENEVDPDESEAEESPRDQDMSMDDSGEDNTQRHTYVDTASEHDSHIGEDEESVDDNSLRQEDEEATDEDEAEPQSDDEDPLASVSDIARKIYAYTLHKWHGNWDDRTTIAELLSVFNLPEPEVRLAIEELSDMELLNHQREKSIIPMRLESWHSMKRNRKRTTVDRLRELLQERATRNLRLGHQIRSTKDPLTGLDKRALYVYCTMLDATEEDAFLKMVDEATIATRLADRRPNLIHTACMQLQRQELVVAAGDKAWLSVPVKMWHEQREKERKERLERQRPRLVVDRVRDALSKGHNDQWDPPSRVYDINKPLWILGPFMQKVYEVLDAAVKRDPYCDALTEDWVSRKFGAPAIVEKVHAAYLKMRTMGLVIMPYKKDMYSHQTDRCWPVPLDMWREEMLYKRPELEFKVMR